MTSEDYLAAELTRLEAKLPTDEELAYLRNRKEADEHAMWLVKQIRAHAPWVMVVLGSLGSATYFLMTNAVSITPKK